MEEVKSIKENGFVLTHSWFVDIVGFKRNAFNLFHEKTRVHYPFRGDIRVSNYDRNAPYEGDDVSPYTDEQYKKMFEEQVANFINSTKASWKAKTYSRPK